MTKIRMRAWATVLTGVTLAATAITATPAAAAPTSPLAPLAAAAGTERPVNPRTGLPLGVMPMKNAVRSTASTTNAPATSTTPKTTAAIGTPHLDYLGGPVVSNAHVVSVLWGSGTYLPQLTSPARPNMASFFDSVTRSSHLSWLNTEYRTTIAGGTGQTIGLGSSDATNYAITPPPSVPIIGIPDSTVRDELLNAINAGQVPQPAFDAAGHANTVYSMFFPSGASVCRPEGCSGQLFCAYHDSISVTDGLGRVRTLLYMVLPDFQSANMIQGCGSPIAPDAFRVTQSVASHELIEAITDPEVGPGGQIAWYDQNNNNGEIADICQFAAPDWNGTITGAGGVSYVVQREWSNAQGACIVDKSADTKAMAAFQLARRITVRYAATDAESHVARFDVQYRVAAWNGGFGGYSTLATATRATAMAINGSPGHEYCFRVRARDFAGNASGWSSDRCTALPLDDRSLAAVSAGWSRSTSSSAYFHTVTRTTANRAALRLAGARGDRIALVVTACRTCGVVGIYVNGRLWHTVNTVARTTHYHVVRLPGTYRAPTATIVLKNLSPGRQVIIDGLGISRM